MNKAFASTPVRAAVLLLVLAMGGCSSVDSSNDKIDYRAGARKTAPLDVPPDLTALARDGRYTPQAGSVSANALQQPSKGSGAGTGSNVAPVKAGDVRLERQGSTRWLVTPQAPELVYPKVKQFWTDLGLNLVTDSPETGVLETDWAENRAKLPQDLIRSTIGKVFESLYSTGERDKYRTRIERGDHGTEITISHRGLEEVVMGKDRDGSTIWTNRPNDPQLEAEMLSRLMLALGGSESAAKAIVASGAASGAAATVPATVAKARLLTAQAGVGAGLIVDDSTERAWRRVGLALDRSGFTVEDRDRAQMLYFVRYADPKSAGHEEPGFFARLFSSKEAIAQLSRYRIAVKASGNQTVVNVLTADGAPDNSANAQGIATRLVEELKN